MRQTKFFPPRFQNVDANGNVIVGSLVFYQTGTTTKVTTYSDYQRTSANANPLNADANGRFGPVFFNPSDLSTGIRVDYYDAADGPPGDGGSGNLIYTDDRYEYHEPIVWADISGAITNINLGGVLYPRTQAEEDANIAAYNASNTAGDIMLPHKEPGDPLRYGLDQSDTGDNNTLAIQAALDSNAFVQMPDARQYLVGDSLYVKSNQIFDLNGCTLKLKNSVTLAYTPVIYVSRLKKTGVQSGTGYEEFSPSISIIENTTIRNGTIDGNQANNTSPDTTAPYNGYDGGMNGIWVMNNADEITLENLTIINAGTDGITVGGSTVNNAAYNSENHTNIRVLNCDCDGSYRQGCSVIKGNHMWFSGSRFRNTSGTAPSAGMDFEPNDNSQNITQIWIDNCDFHDNDGSGLVFDMKGGNCTDIFVDDVRTYNNDQGGSTVDRGVSITGRSLSTFYGIHISNCQFYDGVAIQSNASAVQSDTVSSASGTTVSFNNIGDTAIGDLIELTLDSGAIFYSLATNLSGSNVTIADTIPSAVTAGNAVDAHHCVSFTVQFVNCVIGDSTWANAAVKAALWRPDSVVDFSNCTVLSSENSTSQGTVEWSMSPKSSINVNGGLIENTQTNGNGIYATNNTSGNEININGTQINCARYGLFFTNGEAWIGGGAIIENAATGGARAYSDNSEYTPELRVGDALFRNITGTGVFSGGTNPGDVGVKGASFDNNTTDFDIADLTLISEVEGSGVPTGTPANGSRYWRTNAGNENEALYVSVSNTWTAIA